MDAHGVAGTGLVPLEEKFQNQPVVPDGDVLHVLPVLGNLKNFIDGAVNDRV